MGRTAAGREKAQKNKEKKKRAGLSPVRKSKKERREIRKKEGVGWGNKIGKNKLKINKNIRRVLLQIRILIKIFNGHLEQINVFWA